MDLYGDCAPLAYGAAMNVKLWHIGAGLAAGLLIWWGVAFGLDTYHQHQGAQNQAQANHHDQEAQAHVNQAQSVPDHSQELAKAQADVDRARAEVARLKRLLATKPLIPIPDSVTPNPSHDASVASDNRDQVIAAQDVLIKAQDTQITGLKLALSDEQKRSYHWESAYNDEHKAFMAQQAATEAWKKAVKESRWTGRIEGFAAGIALGYAGGKL